jgi:hypothetical protein
MISVVFPKEIAYSTFRSRFARYLHAPATNEVKQFVRLASDESRGCHTAARLG